MERRDGLIPCGAHRLPYGCLLQQKGGTPMVAKHSPLVLLVQLIDQIPLPPPSAPARGRPRVYSDRLFLKALVIMVLRQLATVHALVAVLDQPSPEMQQLRALLSEDVRYPSRRTF